MMGFHGAIVWLLGGYGGVLGGIAASHSYGIFAPVPAESIIILGIMAFLGGLLIGYAASRVFSRIWVYLFVTPGRLHRVRSRG